MEDSAYTLFARATCNVLPNSDSAVYELHFNEETHVIYKIVEAQPGYGMMPDLVGSSFSALAEWSMYDNTGTHPESYHNVGMSMTGPWVTRSTSMALTELASLGITFGEAHASGKPLHCDSNGWHFADETWGNGGGPFSTIVEARDALDAYCKIHLGHGSDSTKC